MSPPKPFLGILLIVGFLLGFVRSHQNQTQSAYEILESYNFPRGILPKGVKSYVLKDDGSFVVQFGGSCKFQIEAGYTLDYKSRITGVLKYGSLKNLQGVSVKILFFWLGISEVDRGEGNLDFYVGPLSASFGLSNFYESPQCGCGFDCDDVNGGGGSKQLIAVS
ncbi:uncharacterized protein LOC116257766 [Nymphaea colorata]|uniref:DUF538 domain-containing protein n=1 Tax=Nymphaea colorata TaxID=210225 RepID=A0A5K1EZX9_9MAGN|nr:uncharacterized protein LOC116257766 [Nymphaea colorata]VVW54456.1 unnamed protein product [Nymphaea colorata]